MKKARIGLLLTASVIFLLFSCDNQLLPRPFIPGGENSGFGSRNAVPDGLTASHGEKQSITLSWNQNANAALYYVYKADSPLDTFVRCGETSNTQLKFSVNPGTTAYYRVSFVSYGGSESAQSMYVRGTSLAQPLISDITDKNESEVTVIWYMDNVSNDTYKNNLLYTVYCFNGSIEVAQLSLDGAALVENKATFPNLTANTRYEYQVEAYLRSDQNTSEKSLRVEAATARRMRPGAPINLRTSRGIARDKIELSFELPDMVDIPLGDNQYDPKPVYFKIFKRLYSASGTNQYQTACSYFGSIPANAAAITGGRSFESYTPGTTVRWTDNTVSRGVEYEYQVQAYVDDTPKVITADSSKASERGWALSEGSLSFGDISYTHTPSGDFYAKAQLPLDFNFDPKGVIYNYSLVEKIEPIDLLELDPYDPDGTVTRTNALTYNEIKNHVAQMNLTQKTTEISPGRGLYSYAVEIKLNNETIDTVSTIGKIEVSENTDPIIVEGFSVQDGYTDKFVFKWHNHENRRYVLYESADGSNWTEIATVNNTPNNGSTNSNSNFSYPYTAQTPGTTKYFAIRPYRVINGTPKSGQMVYAAGASKTLGIPELSLGTDASYSTITAIWSEAQKADTYRIKYWYTDGGSYNSAVTAATVSKNELTIDASGKFMYPFIPFSGNTIDAAKAGLEIQVAVDALNEGLKAEVGGGEISTSSRDIPAYTRLVGPAQLNPSASRASSPMEINVSWDKTAGARGYYVFRRQFNMNNTAEEGTEAIVYYVPAVESSINIIGKNLELNSSNVKEDATTVKAAASFANSRYTLTDIYMPDLEYVSSKYTPAYRDQQNDMAQGFSYRYYIVPVVNSVDFGSIEFVYAKDGSNKNTNINYYTIRENGRDIRYNGASALEQEGFTIGFGQDVTATKGTYASSGNVNDRIQISWSLPSKLTSIAGFSPRYTLYRKAYESSVWDTVANNINGLQYLDTPQKRGVTYEYVVGIANGSGTGSQPKDSIRFINRCGTLHDERGRPNYLGFMLDMVKMNNVSRDARSKDGQFAEEVKWYSAGVQNPYDANYNWGIDGYTIYLLNRNMNNGRQWTELSDTVPMSNQIDQIYTVANDANNRLKIFRDYRHYYKVRSYVLNSFGEKVYCPDPAPEYVIADGRNDDYVKWGTRQVSTEEYASIVALAIGTGMNWVGNDTGDVPDRNSGIPVSISESNVGYNRRINFNNAKPYFITVNGDLHGYCTATQNTPTQYGADCDGAWGALSGAKDHLSTLTFTGPSDAGGMFSGQVTILRMSDSSGNGNAFRITYNGANSQGLDPKYWRDCFSFQKGSKNYKKTRDFDWSLSGGVINTSPSKWWYPINGSRAGWD